VPPSLHRVPLGAVPRIQRYYEALRLPDALPFGFVSFTFRYRLAAETSGSPRFLGDPLVHMPCSQTPEGPPGSGHSTQAMLPSARNTASAPSNSFQFRGSITRPMHSLSTLRRTGLPATTQDSLPAAGLLCRAGLNTRWVPLQGFRWRSCHLLPPRPSFAWRKSLVKIRSRPISLSDGPCYSFDSFFEKENSG